MAVGADRTRRAATSGNRLATIATIATLIATMLVLGWAMAANTLSSPVPPPAWLQLGATAVNVTAVVVLCLRRPPRTTTVLALALGLAVALPIVSVLVHRTGPAGAPVPLLAAVAGSATAVAVLAPTVLAQARAGTVSVPTTSVATEAVPAPAMPPAVSMLPSAPLATLVPLATATAVVWLSALLGLESLLSGPLEGAYERNARDWLGIWQLKGVAGHPNALALICCLALLLQLSFLRGRRFRSRGATVSAWLAGPGVTTLTLLWTQSRTGWMAAALAVGVLLLPWRRRLLAGAVVAVAGGWAVAAIGPPALATLGIDFHGRNLAWGLARYAIEQEPLLGPGPTMFDAESWNGALGWGWSGWEPVHAHNALLSAGVLLGLVGMAVLSVAVVTAFVVAARARRGDGGLALAAGTAMAVFAGVEPALGVGAGGAVYLPAILFGMVLGNAAATAAEVTNSHLVLADASQQATSPPTVGERWSTLRGGQAKSSGEGMTEWGPSGGWPRSASRCSWRPARPPARRRRALPRPT